MTSFSNTPFPPTVETPRLILELHSRNSDEQYESLMTCLRTPRAIKFIGLDDLATAADIDEIFAGLRLQSRLLKGHGDRDGLIQQDCVYHIRPKVDNPGAGHLVGFVVLLQRDDGIPPDEGWLLMDEYNGNGYATEAGRGLLNYVTGVLGIREVMAWPKESNTGSVKVAERMGMMKSGQILDRKTGELRAVFATQGTKWPPVDLMLMPKSRPERLEGERS